MLQQATRPLALASLVLLGLAPLGCQAPAVSGSGSGRGGAMAGGRGGGAAAGGGGGGDADGGLVFVVPDGGDAKPYVEPDAGPARPCEGLQCQQTTCTLGACKQQACPGGGKTTLRGRVFDPAGRVPLYNVVVYVPNAALDPIPTGPSCARCDSPVSGKPIAAALTDTKGEFVLDHVPVGTGIPLVIQVGKWRRQISLPETKACTENRVDDANLLRLPRNQKEGHIPRIALTTGGYDKLECLLRKIGIDDSEFTPETGPGRVTLYGGKGNLPAPATVSYAPALNGGAAFAPAIPFWSDPNSLKKYDVVLFSCEGDWNEQDKSPAARQALVDYANMGGRVFASHWHGVWVQFGPTPWDTVAKFVPPNVFGNMDQHDPPNPFTADIDTSFPKGVALADWLVNVQASMMRGQLVLTEPKHTVISVDPRLGRRWIYSDAIPPDNGNVHPTGVQYFTFNTPVGAEAGKECGRTVVTDIHVSAGDMAGPPFPQGCVTTELSPQEKALEFMLFDLSSCVMPDDQAPRPPVYE